MHIFSKASAKGKRVQCNMGTKNHNVVMQDVDLEATLNTPCGSCIFSCWTAMYGNQHCSTVFGDSKSWEEGLKTRALKLKVTTGIEQFQCT
jgi:malonate-semialdehyde dehydrogenase (acetylating)/methylmalonate-semialdehyde dehydrogenase